MKAVARGLIVYVSVFRNSIACEGVFLGYQNYVCSIAT